MKLDNNINPRLCLDTLEKSGKYSPRLIAKLRRRESAEKNCWEGLPMILAAVVAGNTVGLSDTWMNGATLGYFLARCGFSKYHMDFGLLDESDSAEYSLGLHKYRRQRTVILTKSALVDCELCVDY